VSKNTPIMLITTANKNHINLTLIPDIITSIKNPEIVFISYSNLKFLTIKLNLESIGRTKYVSNFPITINIQNLLADIVIEFLISKNNSLNAINITISFHPQPGIR